MKLARSIRWYLDHLDTPPTRLHVREVWADYSAPRSQDFSADIDVAAIRGGSHLGTRAYSRSFAQWLEHAEATLTERFPERCAHPGLTELELRAGVVCRACCSWKEDPDDPARLPVPDHATGWVQRSRVRYRWPMQAALARLGRLPVRAERPNAAAVLMQLAMADGDLDRVASVLAARFPAMGDVHVTAGYVAWALGEVRRFYRTEPALRVSTPRIRSDAQLDAEAATP